MDLSVSTLCASRCSSTDTEGGTEVCLGTFPVLYTSFNPLIFSSQVNMNTVFLWKWGTAGGANVPKQNSLNVRKKISNGRILYNIRAWSWKRSLLIDFDRCTIIWKHLKLSCRLKEHVWRGNTFCCWQLWYRDYSGENRLAACSFRPSFLFLSFRMDIKCVLISS